MSNLDIPVALALIVGGLLAYLVWLHVRAAERTARRVCVSCRRRIGPRIGGTS